MNFNYIRVSTVDQNTDRQLKDIPCDEIFAEKLSGKNIDRPELQRLLGYIRSGDTINVHSIDRLARSTADLLVIVKAVEEEGAVIKFHKENMTFGGTTESNPFKSLMLTMLSGIAEFERNIMLERQREGIAIAKDKGAYKGRKESISPEVKAELKDRFAAANKAELAREFGISRAHLYRICK
jgi:DNA invertase Pin-like site-specific DNA recombinase